MQASLFDTDTIPMIETKASFQKENKWFEPWDSLAQWASVQSVDFVASNYFHSLLKVGDKVKVDMSRFKDSYYWGKSYHNKTGVIKYLGISSADVLFEEEKPVYMNTEDICEVNGKKFKYQDCIPTINKMINDEKVKT
ncbi:hypothetical protein [Arcobacter roscoffensis]|uniref:YopX protein domain-containing protein n=1 Tax=Arcobacter roscoffensis TaxID=2961520 RepID=A0ABY5E3U7_9BACT|nr:hypothetical protein [Arcobacter roscoffensis]UTJ05411.1 hypothetical protein NJU99_09035 [Arcobacter roscoffensis]